MHTAGSQAQLAYEKYLQRILFLVIVVSIFSLLSTIGISVLFLNQNDESTKRSKITREIIVTVGACLIEPPPKEDGDALRQCVNQRLDKLDDVEKGDLDAPR
jgi:hypothetical protein